MGAETHAPNWPAITALAEALLVKREISFRRAALIVAPFLPHDDDFAHLSGLAAKMMNDAMRNIGEPMTKH